MAGTHTYYIEYMLDGIYSEVKGIMVASTSKADAYDQAVYEAIPAKEGKHPWSAWVHSVTYQNGNYRTFNTFSGNPY